MLNVVVTMIRQCAPKIPLPRRRAPFVAGLTQRNYKRCDVYRRLQTAWGVYAPRPRPPTPRIPAPQVDTGDVRHFPPLLHTQPPVPPSKPPPAPCSHVVASGSQSVELGAQLSVFLTEFKSLFNQLMQQTSTILTMLTTVLPRLIA
jgi:hypothetical protein